jgi:imidazolonepropionase-like amidohydrolase
MTQVSRAARINKVAVMMLFPAMCIITLVHASLLAAARQSQAESGLAIVGATLIDVVTGRSAPDTTILIRRGRILSVGPSPSVPVPDGVRAVQAKGLWAIPGLIDMHVHVSTVANVPLDLYVVNGVTAIRDLGGHLSVLRSMRESADTDGRPSPRLFIAGPMLDGLPPSAPRISIIANSPTRAASAVEFLATQGVDVIKVYNGIDEPGLAAIISAASAHRKPVVGHVPRAVTAKRAMQLGMSGIEHTPLRITDLEAWKLVTPPAADRIRALTSVTEREAAVWQHIALDAPPLRELIAEMARRGVVFDPTLSIDEYDTLFLYDQEATHPNNRYLEPSFVRANLGSDHELFRVRPAMKALAVSGLKKRQQFVAISHGAGVPIVTGTDGPGIGRLAPGFGLHRELALLVEAGLTPLQALRAATINAAKALGQQKALGTVEPGKLADLVLLKADPLEAIANLTGIEAVVSRGQILERSALDAVLNRLEAAAGKER